MRRGAATSVLVLAGCANNAIFELEIELPAADPDTMFVRVDAQPDPESFCADFAHSTLGEVIELGSDPSTRVISVVASGSDIDARLGMRIRFCSGAEGAACDDRTVTLYEQEWLLFARAFYRGRYTRYVHRVASIPGVPGACDLPTEIDRCLVQGCRAGPPLSSYCRLGTTTHFCE